MKKITIALLITLFFVSCARQVTPYQAANRGGMKCGKHHLK
jgi:PBP1b-binding outer membrane lipoprotein LpoB